MNPIELLQQHCEFNDPNDCYVLLAVSRKKDTPSITNSQEIVFRKVIKKADEITRKYNQVKTLASNYIDEEGNKFPFYIYVSLNARDAYKATHLLMNNILHYFYEEHKGTDRSKFFKRLDGQFYSVLMKPESRTTSQKYFMIDYDDKEMPKFQGFLNECDELISGEFRELDSGNAFFELFTETKNGFHVKLKPFDRRLLEPLKEHYDFEIKTDANLFIEYVKR